MHDNAVLTFPLRYVKPADTLDSWAAFEPYFDELRDRSILTREELVRWLEDASELLAAVQELGTDRHVKMTCQSDDPQRKAAFLDYIENIEPRVKPRVHELNIKYVHSAVAADLPRDRYHVLDRAVRASVELFRPENIPLQTEEARLGQQYQEISGAQTVEFDGRERTLQQLAPYVERTDREVRQSAWEAEVRRRQKDVAALEDIFDRMVNLRHRIATNAGCTNYIEYAFREKHRFDYSPADCLAFHDAVEQTAVPLYRKLQRERGAALGLDRLRPWDLSVDVKGRPPLRPFETAGELCEKSSRVFHRVSADLGRQFDEMRQRGYLDLESRKGKAPGGYQATYELARHPFIFMNAVGVNRDVRTLLHEGGHAFHCFAARHDPLLAYRSSPIEFAEVASFGMELLTLDFIGEFYHGEELDRARRSQLEGIVSLFPWVATIDAFQHWIYAHPGHSRDQRRSKWLELWNRFGGIADYSGYEEALAFAWHKQLHLFEVPLYYIEYAIAKIGALQVWRNSREGFPAAVERYRAALKLSGGRPLPELFEAAGARFDFSRRTMEPLVESLEHELQALPI